MLFGHNTDVKAGDTVYHVQTEDRGGPNALIDTTVYCRGRVVHRVKDSYMDLLPLDPERENSLRQRIDGQHREVAEDIRSGALKLEPPPVPVEQSPAARKNGAVSAHANSFAGSPGLEVELINAKTWLAAKRANLHVAVRKTQNGDALVGATVTAHVDGAAVATEFSTRTGADGQARLEFEMPPLVGVGPALVIEATHAEARAQLKFQLKTRPRVPAVKV